MKASVLRTFNVPAALETVPDPTCPADGVIIAVEACGVCRSDHHAYAGVDPDVELPHIMGHELAGRVAEVGKDVSGFSVGERVTAPFILGCGHCSDCQRGQQTVCADQHVIGFSGWGAFAQYVAVPHATSNLVRVPDAIEMETAAGMGCRVTTAFRAVVDRGALMPGEWLCVHGCGGAGLAAVMIGAACGAGVIAVDINPDALKMARDLGASHVVNATDPTMIEQIHEISRGGVHVSLDALGITATFHNSLRSLRKLGRHVQIGMPVGPHATPPLPLLDLVYANQLSLHGTRGIAAQGFRDLLAMVEADRLDLAPLITDRITLGQAGAAVAAMDGFVGSGISVVTDFTA